MIELNNQSAWINAAKAELKKFEEQAVAEVKMATRVLVSELFAKTPVWSGETVRNYIAGVGGRPSGISKGHLGPKPPPRPTSGMALGSEDNRSDNETAAMGDVNAAINGMKTLSTVFVTNLIDDSKWDLLEHGSAPTKERSRSPGGVSILALQAARAKLEHFK